MQAKRIRRIIRYILVELVIYGAVVLVYFFLVLRYLQDGLHRLYVDNLAAYAFVSLGLIVAQGVFLEIVTSLLVNHLHSRRTD